MNTCPSRSFPELISHPHLTTSSVHVCSINLRLFTFFPSFLGSTKISCTVKVQTQARYCGGQEIYYLSAISRQVCALPPYHSFPLLSNCDFLNRRLFFLFTVCFANKSLSAALQSHSSSNFKQLVFISHYFSPPQFIRKQ